MFLLISPFFYLFVFFFSYHELLCPVSIMCRVKQGYTDISRQLCSRVTDSEPQNREPWVHLQLNEREQILIQTELQADFKSPKDSIKSLSGKPTGKTQLCRLQACIILNPHLNNILHFAGETAPGFLITDKYS